MAGAGRAWARGQALQAARRAGAGRSWRVGVRSRRPARQAGRASGRRAGRQVRGRQVHGRQARGRAAGRAGRAAGRAGRAAGRAGRAAGRAGRVVGRAGRAAGALLSARSSLGTGAMRPAMHGLGVAWALDGCAGWASWASFGAQCTWLSSDSFFGPGSTRYFPESLNEHCSSQIFSKKKNFIKIK